MRILILGLNYAPEPVGIGPYTRGLAEGLVERGHAVSVIAGKPYYPQWRPYAGQAKGITTAVENGVTVTRVPHYIPATPSAARRLLHHASFAASALRPDAQVAGAAPDLVFTIAPSLMSVPVAALAAYRARAPLWLHVQDFEVEAAFATGLVGKGGRLRSGALAAEERILRMADHASSISPQMCAKLVDKGLAPEQVYQLRNWSTTQFDFASSDSAAYRSRWNLGDRKVALYSGNIANKQGLDVVIEAARLLRNRTDIAFVICGEGPNRANLQAQADGLDNVQFHDLQPAEQMGSFLSLASVQLLPQIMGAADLVLPSKLTNMLASGRPVLATAEPGTGLYAEVEGCGTLTPPGDPAGMAEGLVRLIDDPDGSARYGDAARRRAQERWSKDSILDALHARLCSLQPAA
ncbi:WcaI family glycosyltransferase [Croceibacterium ferulae]|uniref:WcaI family glycosyltransferase n=1 Tax=Croceibacterium ferulae TaxID=1854641 RepID=UPI000EB0CC12|nr:WcaI family glycosyltransferase [Croceibacterium ferulae]